LPGNIETNTGVGVDVENRRAPERTPLGWLRFAIPSVADLVFVLLLLALTLGAMAKGLLGDAGIGWHIRTGEWILRNHAVPRVDLFSSTMAGKEWFAWEWLYDVIAGALHHVAGLNGVVFGTALVIALTFTLLLRRTLKDGANLLIAVLMLLLAVAASTIHFLARPHVLSWLFAVIWFGALDDFEERGNWRRLAWFPVLMLLWVNLHGGFLLGFALLGIYFVSALIVGWTSGSVQDRADALNRARVLVGVAAVSALVTLLNPYGYRLHLHIYRYLTDRFLMDHIDEFLSPNFHGLAQKCFAVIVLLAVVALGAARKRIGVSHALLMLFAIYTGLFAARNIPVSSMLLVLVVAPQLSAVLREGAGSPETSEGLRRLMARFDSFGARMARMDSGLSGHVWPALAALAILGLCLHHGDLGSRKVLNAHFSEIRFPVKAADFLAASGDAGPVFSLDRWGGYFIYRLYPERKVAVDDRHDFYGTEFLKNYLKIVRGEPGWSQALEAMHAGWVVVPADSVVTSLLRENSGWKAVYTDETAVVFRPAR
jgi:hypothetical protein